MPRFEPHPGRRPAIVTGASSGIGTATAYALAELGHPVALGARRVDECEAVAEKIRGEGGEAFAHHLDVSSTDSVDRFVTAAEDALGPTEIV
ncbi:SDR family NAD(P)-dependent oxidoreductase, partial [Nocardia sp. NPDC050793]